MVLNANENRIKPMICCICGDEINGNGHNPWPTVNDEEARCCDKCNYRIVIPDRIKEERYEYPEVTTEILRYEYDSPGEMEAAIREYETVHEPRVEDSFILYHQINEIHDLAVRENGLLFYSIVYGMMAGYSRGYKDGLKAAANKRTARNLRQGGNRNEIKESEEEIGNL